jgi:teichuronic acid biosynthesis glycosyltransferase TuaG
MTTSSPKVSVVIPVYNQGKFLPEAIDSVLGQHYAPMEVIVVDDGSADETPAVIRSYGNRIRAMSQTNRGAAHALNRGIRAADGELVCWLSADDRFLASKVLRQVPVFAENHNVGVCCTAARLVDVAGSPFKPVAVSTWRHADPFVSVFWANPINGSSVMMRRRLFEEMGGFDEFLRADVDGAMWLRCALASEIVQLDVPLVEYRIHRNTLSANRTLMLESMIAVRMPYVRDGTLLNRMKAADADPPQTLAAMAEDFAWWGMRSLSGEVLELSRTTGRAPWRQVRARTALALTGSAQVHEVVRRIGGAIRRAVWRIAARLYRTG